MWNLNYDKGGKFISLELVPYPIHIGITPPLVVPFLLLSQVHQQEH